MADSLMHPNGDHTPSSTLITLEDTGSLEDKAKKADNGYKNSPVLCYQLGPDRSYHVLDKERTLKANPKSRMPEVCYAISNAQKKRVFPEFNYKEYAAKLI